MDGRTPVAEAPAGPIIWLASYPKSGNTWLRAFLTSYLRADSEPFSINALIGGTPCKRIPFDEYLGSASSDMTQEEILEARPRFHVLLAEELAWPTFLKVHDACIRAPRGAALFPRSATAGAVYLIRNPLDVAVSLAHHYGMGVDAAIAEMRNAAAILDPQTAWINRRLPQPLLTWSAHVSSWQRDVEFPVHVVRYEDLLADPVAGFGGIVRFCGLDWSSARLARADRETTFGRLRGQEARFGFNEKPPAAARFFRVGVAGAWRTTLRSGQVRSLVATHGPMMDRFGYLREAEAHLGVVGRGPALGMRGSIQGSCRVDIPSSVAPEVVDRRSRSTKEVNEGTIGV